jgi:3-oxoacyl-[acyl-carrier protein] reductase
MARIVVVSGGGTGIGLAVARRMSQAGDRVVIVGRRESVLKDAAAGLGERVGALAADLRDPAAAQRVVETVEERFGQLDVLVNCAGGNAEIGAPPPADLAGKSQRWQDNFSLNVLTAVHLTEAAKPLLADGGRVLLLSSIAAFRGSGSGSYAASKAALHPYAIDLSDELGRRGITVNVIAPGYIEETEFFRDRMTEARRTTLIGQTHNGRAGTPEDVAELAYWLSLPEAGHLTGQVLQLTGGAR